MTEIQSAPLTCAGLAYIEYYATVSRVETEVSG